MPLIHVLTVTVDTALSERCVASYTQLVGTLLTQGANKIWPKPLTPADLQSLKPYAIMRQSKPQTAAIKILEREQTRLEVCSLRAGVWGLI